MDADQFAQLILTLQQGQAALVDQLRLHSSEANPSITPHITNHNVPAFEAFDPKREKFRAYLVRFENYISMRGIQPNSPQAASFLLHSIGQTHFNTVSALVAPKPLATYTYTELITALTQHLAPKRNVVVSQHYYLNTFQKENQSIADYIALLQRDLAECEFTTTCECGNTVSIAENFLRAQFIRGIRDNTIREKILQADIIDFAGLLQKAIAYEASKIECAALADKSQAIGNTTSKNITSEDSLSSVADTHQISKKKPFDRNTNNYQRRSRANSLPGNRSYSNNRSNSFQRRSYNTRFPDRSPSNYRGSNTSHRVRKKIDYRELGIENLCMRCARNNHIARDCFAKNLQCTSCKKDGHVAKVCLTTLMRNTQPSQSKTNNYANHLEYDSTYNTANLGINNIIDIYETAIDKYDTEKYYVNVLIGKSYQTFEVDSGAGYTLIPEDQFRKLDVKYALQRCSFQFRTYTGERFSPRGVVLIPVTYNNITSNLRLYIVPAGRSALLGRQWIRRLKINLAALDVNRDNSPSINTVHNTDDIFEQYAELFTEKVGKVPGFQVNLELRPNTKPVFIREREVPYALREQVDQELTRLEEDGIITKIQNSDWGSPLVVIPKENGTVRLCVDYKTGVNDRLVSSNFPIRKVEDVFNSLRDSRYFCKLDLYKAYLHIPVDSESAKIQTISTMRGTYMVNRLSFGIKTAPSEFNRILHQILKGLHKTDAYFDDIIVHGTTMDECAQNLHALLSRLKEYDLHLNKAKCSFFQEKIDYLGHVISYNTISTSQDRVYAIDNMKRPTTIDGVRQFLGMITYYARFIPDCSSITHPLRQLLQKKAKFFWSHDCENAFRRLKAELKSDRILIPYNPELPVILTTDASPVGIAAVLSHKINGEERPIAYASRALTTAERHYSQLDREALAIVYGVQKFYMYLYGRKFHLVTDNRPLSRIFNSKEKLPAMSAARLLRYATFLSGFNYELHFKNGELNKNVDCLSRNTVLQNNTSVDTILNVEISNLLAESINTISTPALSAENIAIETDNDPELRQLKQLLQTQVQESEYTIDHGILFYNTRVVIPTKLRPIVLEELHSPHVGIQKMKQLARRYVYWKKIDNDIETMVKSCTQCALVKTNPPKITHIWDPPTKNWERVHIDYAGPFQGYYYLLCIDARSKWLEIRFLHQAPSTITTIKLLDDIFSFHGFPEYLVSDNASIFTSTEFETYCTTNGITLRHGAPYHPATNGLAERNVQTIKNKLKALEYDARSMKEKLNLILFRLRALPLACGQSPAELYLGRKLRLQLDAIMPKYKKMNRIRPLTEAPRTFQREERVQFRQYGGGPPWAFGIVQRRLGQLHYTIRTDHGTVVKRHVNQMRTSKVPKPPNAVRNNTPERQPERAYQRLYELRGVPSRRPPPLPPIVEEPQDGQPPCLPNAQPERRSTRVRRPPRRYRDFYM